MTQVKPATVRFYFDADVLGLARLICRERGDSTFPGDAGARIKKRERPPCPIRVPSAKDSEWIPTVAALGWVIITRDRRIQERPAEIEAVRSNRAKMVNLSSAEAGTTWAQLEVFMIQWRRIEALVHEGGPFIYSASRSSFRRLEL